LLLRYGTAHSLAVLDELGRGTSTFDGAAIAAAVLDDLALRIRCRALFATHFHPVSHEACKLKEVAPYHVAAKVDEQVSSITFLYKLLPGLCPASHGHNVARLAGLPSSVLEEALKESAAFDQRGEGIAEVGTESQSGNCVSRRELAAEIARLAEVNDVVSLHALFPQVCQLGG